MSETNPKGRQQQKHQPPSPPDARAVREALDELDALTSCRCDPAWTGRNLHEPWCRAEYREDVDVLRAALQNAPYEPSASGQ